MSSRTVLPALLALLLAATACARLKPDAGVDPDAITDAASLAEYLGENDVGLLEHGPIISPYLSVPGYEYTPTSGGLLQVFKYPTDIDAASDITNIERGRNARQLLHLYRKADLVVLYWGEDPRVEVALVRVFGTRLT